MAKTSSVEKNNRRRKLAAQYAAKRKRLKALASDLSKPLSRIGSRRASSWPRCRATPRRRIRNRCELTGRARSYLRKIRMCRNQLRELASKA